MKKIFYIIALVSTHMTFAHPHFSEYIDTVASNQLQECIQTETAQDLNSEQQAHTLFQEKKYEQALELYKKELEQSPHSFSIHVNMGKIYEAIGQHDKALESFTRALENRPSDNTSNTMLGNCLLNLGNHFFGAHKTEQAIDTFKKIFTINPNLAAVHHNIAFTYAEQNGDFDSAIAHYKKAVSINPDNMEVHFCYALSLLATGNLIEGFKEYEYRWKRGTHAPRSFNYPIEKLWNGTTDLHGKRIVINVEQGLGDTLQFIRYAQLLKSKGAIVIAETQKPLAQLLSLCPYLDEVVAIGKPLPQFDAQIPMLNLPLAFKTTLETIPHEVPYLRADPRLIVEWRSYFAKATKDKQNFKIGICWRGDAAHGASKFMPFNFFARLAEIKGISVYSLQKNEPNSSIKASDQANDTHIKQFDADFDTTNGRFMDTAAVIKNMDLIITVDTSIAHLAGGLGVPTWIVLPFPAEWRWLTKRDDSPWYPTMRLFRQKQFGNWNSVFSEILEALAEAI